MAAETEAKKWIWTDEYHIHSYDVDARGKASLTTFGKYMQETAYNHAHHLEFGYHQLKEKNLFWVLARLLIVVERYPQWGEQIRVQTWPSGIEGLLAYRDFRVLDKEGRSLAAAGSAWLMLDAEKRRPQRPDDLKERHSLFPQQYALEERPAKIPALTAPIDGTAFPVRWSDLDLYNHVNNAKYIEWLMDSFPPEIHREFELSRFEINFLFETKIEDEVFIQTERLEDSAVAYRHCIKRKGDNRDICLAASLWNPTGVEGV